MNRVTKKNGIRSLKALTPIVPLLLMMMTVACESQTENSETTTTKKSKRTEIGDISPNHWRSILDGAKYAQRNTISRRYYQCLWGGKW